MNLCLIYGGTSSEAEASRKSGRSVAASLERLGHRVVFLEYDDSGCEHLKALKLDGVFVSVQGKRHGDGTLQAVLELLGLPYSGTRAPSTAVINDKILCKRLWGTDAIPTPAYFELSRAGWTRGGAEGFLAAMRAARLDFPLMAKPTSQGGAIGISYLDGADSLASGLAGAFAYDDPILIERFVPGKSVTVPVVADGSHLATLPLVEVYSNDAGDYTCMGDWHLRLPELSARTEEAMRALAVRAFESVRGRAYGRVDFMVAHDTEEPFVIEVNAVPCFTENLSYYPFSCAHSPDFPVDRVIDLIVRDMFA